MSKLPTEKPYQIPESALQFLNNLADNNNREWFNAHKATFQEEQLHIENFAEGLLEKLSIHDLIETPSGKKVFTVFTETHVFLPTKHPIKRTGAAALNVLRHHAEEDIIFRLSPATAL